MFELWGLEVTVAQDIGHRSYVLQNMKSWDKKGLGTCLPYSPFPIPYSDI